MTKQFICLAMPGLEPRSSALQAVVLPLAHACYGVQSGPGYFDIEPRLQVFRVFRFVSQLGLRNVLQISYR